MLDAESHSDLGTMQVHSAVCLCAPKLRAEWDVECGRPQIKCTIKTMCLPAAFAACYQKHVKWYSLLIFAILWICTALSFFMLPEVSYQLFFAGREFLSCRQDFR